MARLRIHALTISLDGFAAGRHQRADAPFGDGVEGLHDWMTASFRGEGTGVDDAAFRAGGENIGATIMGRNMFGPVRGPWPDESWRGWWGETPPYGHDVFVLTHHPRASLPMDGGTTFHFLEATPEQALARAVEAAGGRDVRVGGGAATVRAFLAAGLVDELNLVIAPLLAGAGERLFERLDALPAGYRVDGFVPGETGTVHVRIVRR